MVVGRFQVAPSVPNAELNAVPEFEFY